MLSPEPGTREAELCGRVESYPEISGKSGKFEFKARYEGKKRGFMAYLKNYEEISYGDRICFKAAITRPYGYAVPGNLNWARYLAAKDILLEARGDAPYLVKKAGFPFSLAAALRARLLGIFEKNFQDDPDTRGVLSGVVLGDKKTISARLKKAFQDSGAMHLLVASGSNVGFLMALFSLLFLKIIKLGRARSLSAALFFTGIYVLSAGLAPPLTRAYLMTFFAMLTFILQRKTDSFQILMVSAFAILLVSPRSLFDPSFQMSFAAVYGLVAGFACWNDLLRIKNRFLSYFVKLLLMTVFSQVALFPLLVVYFHKFSLVSFFSNMVLVPFSGLIMYSGFILLIFEKLGFFFGYFVFLTDAAASFFIKLVYFFGSLRYASVPVPNFNAVGFSALVILLFLVLHFPLLGRGKGRTWVLPGLALFFLAASFFFPKKDFQVYFYEKKIRSGLFSVSGRLIAVNPGSAKLANSALYFGYERIDVVLITSSESFRPEAIREINGIMPVGPVYLPFWAGGDCRGLETVRVWPGDSYEKDFSLKVLWAKKRGGPGYSGLYRNGLGYLVNGKKIIR